VQVPVSPEPEDLAQPITDVLTGLDELTAALSTQLMSTSVASSSAVATPVLFSNRPSMVAVMSDRMHQQADLPRISQTRSAETMQRSLPYSFAPVTISCPRLDTLQQRPAQSSYFSDVDGLLMHAFTGSFSGVMRQSSIQHRPDATATACSSAVSDSNPLRITITLDPNGSYKHGSDGEVWVSKDYKGSHRFT
jgi:hypothetical protein